jgi:hypothetical protein
VAASLHFPAEEWAVLADGQGSYHIVHTHNRCHDHNWQVRAPYYTITDLYSTLYDVGCYDMASYYNACQISRPRPAVTMIVQMYQYIFNIPRVS